MAIKNLANWMYFEVGFRDGFLANMRLIQSLWRSESENLPVLARPHTGPFFSGWHSEECVLQERPGAANWRAIDYRANEMNKLIATL
jgi:hypothetical protein